jgi:glycosyltransferase involved in cell wall biosynthesis
VDEKAILLGDRLKHLDKIFVLSNFHRSLYPNIPDEMFLLTNNGINPEQFKDNSIVRNPHKVLYTSAPDRGLECLLKLWPQIKKAVPDAEFYWCYGWKTFDAIQEKNPNAKLFKEKIVGLLGQDGCHDLGRIGHQELAELMLSAGVWCYPTEFSEINCITAQKMQAAGCIPVCTNVAALKDTVQFGYKVESQNVYSDSAAQTEFVEKTVKALTEPFNREEMQAWAQTTRSWENTAKQWVEEFLT